MPEDREMIALLRRVFAVTADVLRNDPTATEHPFFILGEMLLAQWDLDFPAADALASELTAALEDLKKRNPGIELWARNNRCLLGLTPADRGYADWLEMARRLQNPTANAGIAGLIRCLETLSF